MNDVVIGPLLRGKDLLERTRSAQQLEGALLRGCKNLTNQIAVLVWRVHTAYLQESIASGAHEESSLEQVGQIARALVMPTAHLYWPRDTGYPAVQFCQAPSAETSSR